MNENPGGLPSTPNNQTPPSSGTNPFQPTNPYANPQPQSVDGFAQTTNQTQTFSQPPYGSPAVAAEQAAPAASPEPAKKSKAGLIVGIAVAIIIFVGAAAGIAYALLFANQKDPVSAAFEKLISGETPQYINLAGNVNFHSDTTDVLISDLSIDLSSNFDTRSFLNSSKLTFSATTPKNQTFSSSLSETYAANGDLYFKIDNLSSSLESSGLATFLNVSANATEPTQTQTQIIEEEVVAEGVIITEEGASEVAITETTTTNLTPIAIIKKLEGEWIKIPTDEAVATYENLVNNSDIALIVNLLAITTNERNSLSELYKQYPFIVSSKEKVSIQSKANPIYKISVDEKKLEGFFNAAKANSLLNKIASRLNIDGTSLTIDDVKNTLTSLPAFYVEVDGDYNITRFYTTTNYEDTTMTVDFSLSYPTSINVSEPLEYKDYNVIVQELDKLQ